MKVVIKHISGTGKANLERAKEEMTRVLADLSRPRKTKVPEELI